MGESKKRNNAMKNYLPLMMLGLLGSQQPERPPEGSYIHKSTLTTQQQEVRKKKQKQAKKSRKQNRG